MERLAMEAIAERLASVEGLYFPGAIRQEAPFDTSRRKSALVDLLSRDASIFLERYGAQLTPDELRQFEPLRTEYEVDWHLNRLKPANPQLVNSTTVKNRRRAYLEQLVMEGEYFSEEVMREREPYLHHEYVGRWQDPTGRMMSRPGEKWSETLLRQCDEAVLVGKIRGEQMRRGVDRKEWVGIREEVEEEEEQEEEEEEEEGEEEQEEEENNQEVRKDESNDTNMLPEKDPVARSSTKCNTASQTISEQELQDHMEQFTQIMQHKFLAGEDTEYLDYSRIDNDERLDDHWTREANYDAEEKYFGED